MLTRLQVRNFKRIGHADIEPGGHVVFVGPNNSGKTSALQALALLHTGLTTCGVRCVCLRSSVHIMRTNIDIDDDLMKKALSAGPFKTKKDAVEAGLKLLARQAAYREILKWRGKLKWEGDDSIDWTTPPVAARPAPAPARKSAALTKRRAGR